MESIVSARNANTSKQIGQRSRTHLLRTIGFLLLAMTATQDAWAQLAPADQQEFEDRFVGNVYESIEAGRVVLVWEILRGG